MLESPSTHDLPDSKSKQSAKECRKRKKLRYQTLEATAQREEAAIHVLYQELEQMKLLFHQLDSGAISTDEARLEVGHLRGKVQQSLGCPTSTQQKSKPCRLSAEKQTAGRKKFYKTRNKMSRIQQSAVHANPHCEGFAMSEDQPAVDNGFADPYQPTRNAQLPSSSRNVAGTDSATFAQQHHLADPPSEVSSSMNEHQLQFCPEVQDRHQQHQGYAPITDYQNSRHLQLHQPIEYANTYQTQIWYEEPVQFYQQDCFSSISLTQEFDSPGQVHQLHGNGSVAETLSYINNQASIA